MNSFYDPNTNAYITPGMPPQIINYDNNTDLSNIANAVLAQIPSLILYEGKLPQATIDAFKSKYTNHAHQALDRADAVNAKVAATVVGSTTQGSGAVKPGTGDHLIMPEDAATDGTSNYLKSDLFVESIEDEEVADKPKKFRGKAVADK
jgi:hypothetical protein